MSDDAMERLRAEAERLGFTVSDDLLQQCQVTAQQLRGTASELGAGTEVAVTTNAALVPSDSHRALLATYEEPRQEYETGLLAGVRVALKDNIVADGLPLTCGSNRVAVTPETDATVTERLLGAGATLVGKTNMDAFAFGPSGEFSDYGPVENPIAPDRVPGGSSSGSGAAVAAGVVDVALGSDTGGSIRIPAACCGVVGMKPTHGLVPRHGFVSFAPSLDTIGPLARDVETAARTLAVIAGPDTRDPTAHAYGLPDFTEGFILPDGATIGLPQEFFAAADDAVAVAVRDAVESADIETKAIDLPRGAIEQAYFLVGASEFVWYLDQTGTVRGQGSDYTPAVRELVAAIKEANLGDHIASRLLPSASLDAETGGAAYLSARQEAIEFTRRVESALAEVNALVMPTIRTLPPARDQMKTTKDMLTLLGNTAPFNLARTPAVSVPVTTTNGLPVSAQVVGPRFSDLHTAAIAAELCN